MVLNELKSFLKFGVLVCVFAVFCSITNAQSNLSKTDVSKIDVAKLDDSQLMRLMKEIESRGFSESDAISLAQSRGMSQTQIDLLRSRLTELKNRPESSKPVATEGEKLVLKSDSTKKPRVNATQEEKRLFGYNLFNSKNLSFEPNVNLPASPSYVLGVGDQILISIWGNSQQIYNLKVDKAGLVNIPEVGAIRVGGYKFEEVENIIHSRLSSIYSDLNSGNPHTFATITLGTLKSITVNVIGEVFNPGSYTLPGTATAFNALYLSGGPNILGSFRDIRIIRDGKVFKSLDIFDYLINGNSEVNCSLSDGDVILVPSFEYRIKLSGELKRNGIFEAKKGETLADMIRYAGGFSENAYRARIELYRKDAKEYSFLDIDSTLLVSVPVQNGDSLNVGKLLPRFSNLVSIEGAVFHPGNFQYSDSLSLKQLIEKADGFKEDVFLNRGLISRQNFDLTRSSIYFNPKNIIEGKENIQLQKNDKVTIYSIFDIREEQFIQVFGEVLSPGTFSYEDNLTLSSAILLAKGIKESGSEILIEVSRRLSKEDMAKIGEPIVHLFQFTASRDLKIKEGDSNFKLLPFDQIFIRKAPSYQERSIIRVVGEVAYAGDYSIESKKERLSAIIKRAGGLSPDAHSAGAKLIRPIELTKYDLRIREEMMKKDSLLSFSKLDFEVVGINLQAILANPGGKEDIFVRAGDELTIPSVKQTVKVSGEVTNGLSLTFNDGLSARRYIRKAGGFSMMAKRGRTYVIYPNGESDVTQKRLLFFNHYPRVTAGSEIIVPPRAKREPMSAGMWISIASAMASIALTIATITSLNKK